MSVPWLGDFAEDATVYIPMNTFSSNDPAASVTVTDLVLTDIYVHKDGSATSIVTDGATVDIDAPGVGAHMITIDTSVHADYAVGSEYSVRVDGVTVDGGTVNAWIGSFSIERAGGTIALLKLIQAAVITNATGVDVAADIIAMKAQTVTIAADVVNVDGIVPAAAGDAMTLAAGAVTDASLAGGLEIVFETDFGTNYNTTRNAWVTNHTDYLGTIPAAALGADCITSAKIADNALANEHFANGALTSTEITSAAGITLANGAITNASLAGNMEIVFETDFGTNYNTTRNAWVTNYTDTLGTIPAGDIAAGALDGKGNWNIGKTGYALTTADWNVGKTGYSLTAITGLGAQTANITGNLSGSVGSVTGAVGSVTGHTNQTGDTFALANGGTGFVAIDTVVDAIKVATDKLTFTVANQVDANIQYINDAQVVGDGNATPWDGA